MLAELCVVFRRINDKCASMCVPSVQVCVSPVCKYLCPQCPSMCAPMCTYVCISNYSNRLIQMFVFLNFDETETIKSTLQLHNVYYACSAFRFILKKAL